MLVAVHPKLPMRNKNSTQNFYVEKLGFKIVGSPDFEGYIMVEKDNIQLHFFEHQHLNTLENYGQVYIRVNNIEQLYNNFINNNISIHPNGSLEAKPWGMKEFSLLDPDFNLLTFGEEL